MLQCLFGAALIVTGGRTYLDRANLRSYIFAEAAVLTWVYYSLFTKRVPPFSSAVVGAFCLISGILSLGVHAVVEPSFLYTQLERLDVSDSAWDKPPRRSILYLGHSHEMRRSPASLAPLLSLHLLHQHWYWSFLVVMNSNGPLGLP